MKSLTNILWLGIKELKSLLSDMVLVLFVVYAFTWTIYSQATGTSNEVNNASIAFADEDGSPLSKQLFEACSVLRGPDGHAERLGQAAHQLQILG